MRSFLAFSLFLFFLVFHQSSGQAGSTYSVVHQGDCLDNNLGSCDFNAGTLVECQTHCTNNLLCKGVQFVQDFMEINRTACCLKSIACTEQEMTNIHAQTYSFHAKEVPNDFYGPFPGFNNYTGDCLGWDIQCSSIINQRQISPEICLEMCINLTDSSCQAVEYAILGINIYCCLKSKQCLPVNTTLKHTDDSRYHYYERYFFPTTSGPTTTTVSMSEPTTTKPITKATTKKPTTATTLTKTTSEAIVTSTTSKSTTKVTTNKPTVAEATTEGVTSPPSTVLSSAISNGTACTCGNSTTGWVSDGKGSLNSTECVCPSTAQPAPVGHQAASTGERSPKGVHAGVVVVIVLLVIGVVAGVGIAAFVIWKKKTQRSALIGADSELK